MRIDKAPKSLALIPDGNRRWAKHHALNFFRGYSRGVEKFIDFAEWCKDYGVDNITVWAFSTENFSRPAAEMNTLFGIYRRVATDKSIIDRLHSNKTRFNVIGNKALLPKDLASALHRVEEETGAYKERVINMLIAYGGKDDILHAAKLLVKQAVKSRLRNVSDALFRTYLFSNQVPDIDLIIRTSGEERLSGFMPWQSTYAELYFTKKLWPDFTKRDLDRALVEYANRQRRFGT
jgi:undecaprenyl diphosphate synthase